MISRLAGLNPMSIEEALPRLRRNSPAVVSSTRESETCTTTRVLRMRERLARPNPAGPSLRELTRSGREARKAGTNPNTRAVIADKPSVNTATRQSTLKSKAMGKGSGSLKLEMA